MKVVILCGGKGTRIRDVSVELPKPMIPIGRFPIVKHIMDIYSNHDFNEFVLCLGYKGWKIKEYFLNFQAEVSDVLLDYTKRDSIQYLNLQKDIPWRIILAETGLDTMTGCRIKRVEKYIGNESFMLTYGDAVGNIDVTALVDFHKAHGKLATITSVHPFSRFGKLVVDGDTVNSFEEKPQLVDGLINGGFLVCEPGVFDYVSDDESCEFERTPLQKLASDGQLMTYTHEGFWMPMDTSREYALLNELWNRGDAPWS
jgi:glucose-1-phosphate cytidylyltransferase